MKKLALIISLFAFMMLAFTSLFGVDTYAAGAIWTTTTGCGPKQNVNQYSVGDHVYINGSGFTASTPYSWNINTVPTTTAVASGSHSTDASGNVCFDAYTIQAGDSGVYKATFGDKTDNYQVGSSSVTPTPTQGVTPTPTTRVTPTPTTGVTVTPTTNPTATPTVVPTSAVTPTTPPSDHGDGLSDGRSDGGSSCPQCTQAPIQAVLGASTMADTGTFDSTVMNFVLLGGMLSMGAAAYAKAKNA